MIECAGRTQTVTQALDLVRRGGTVELFGVCPLGETIPLEPNRVYSRELTIVGSYVNPHTIDRAITLLATKAVDVEPLRAHTYPLDGVHEALKELREGTTIKALIRPT